MTRIESADPGARDDKRIGDLATSDVPIVAAEETTAATLRGLEGASFRSASHLAVVADGTLAGVLAIEDLLTAEPGRRVDTMISDRPTVVTPDTDREVAVWNMARDHHTTIAVVDGAGRFHGLVPPATVLAVLEEEHEEDLARLGGYLHDTEIARTASTEVVRRRLWHRLPWLLVGLVAAMAAAGLVSRSEAALAENLALAFFLPGIVYLADAVGTQTETVVIRGLSVGVGIRQVAGREILTGVLIGLSLSAAVLPIVWLWHGRDLAVTVAVALLAASSISTVVALVLPTSLSRFGVDPAFGSGPLATVTQDLLTIGMYFGVARIVIG